MAEQREESAAAPAASRTALLMQCWQMITCHLLSSLLFPYFSSRLKFSGQLEGNKFVGGSWKETTPLLGSLGCVASTVCKILLLSLSYEIYTYICIV